MANKIVVIKPGFDASVLPNDVVVDTNVLIDYVDSKSGVHNNAILLINECLRHSKNLYAPATVILEAHNWINNAAINDIASNLGISYTQDCYKGTKGRKKLQKEISYLNPKYYEGVAEQAQISMDAITSVVEVLQNSEEASSPDCLMHVQTQHAFEIEVADASIIVTANSYGINTIATSDYGYCAGDNLNILALPKGKYNQQRTKSSNSFVNWVSLWN